MPSTLVRIQNPIRQTGSRWLLAVAFLFAGWAQAQQADYQSMAQDWARKAAAAALPPGGQALRLDVSVGPLDSRLKLAPCGNVEAYLPPGSRLWGRSRVGLRCVDGMARWNVSLPATIKAFGPAWVIKSQVMAGVAMGAQDVVEAEVDWAEEPQAVLREPGSWVGQVATRQLGTGQTLRQGMVKAPQVFQAGAQVRVVAQGAGFQVTGEAQALSAGVVGQMARVRMDSGRVATGIVLDVRTVKIEL